MHSPGATQGQYRAPNCQYGLVVIFTLDINMVSCGNTDLIRLDDSAIKTRLTTKIINNLIVHLFSMDIP